MAVGDIINGTITLENSQSANIQPPSGVGYLITNIYYSGGYNYDVDITDGTNNMNLVSAATGHTENKKYMINNNTYLKITNNHFDTYKFIYTGVEI